MSASTLPPMTNASSAYGEEDLRFIRNFHDIFLSIGLVLFGLGLGFVASLSLVESVSITDFSSLKEAGWQASAVFFGGAIIMWLLAEFFARSRRLFLPAIVILIGFSWYLFLAVSIAYVTMFGEQDFDSFESAIEQLTYMPLIVGSIVTTGVFLYYVRMKLPFAMGLGGVGIVVTATATIFAQNPEGFLGIATTVQFFSGLFLFCLGVAFDARDPSRTTRFSDNAFWLHFFAAPLIFASVMSMTSGGSLDAWSDGGAGAAAMTLGVVIVFAIISLLINRRALLVSGLLSAAVAVAVLIGESGLSGAWTGALTLLLLGGAMVLLGGGWHVVRRVLIAPFPKSGPIARIIPPEPNAEETAENQHAA